MTAIDQPIRITEVIAHPLTQQLPRPGVTSWGEYTAVSSVLVEIRTDAGITGIGECLARFAPQAVATIIEQLFAPMLVGRSALDIGRHRRHMLRGYSGRPGGLATEALAGVDIALWDIMGKVAGLPLFRLFGGEGRLTVPAYGSSVDWTDEGETRVQFQQMIDAGFRGVKFKLGLPIERAIRQAEFARKIAGDGIALYGDSNWGYSVGEAIRVGEALAANGFGFFEEPLHPDDLAGYRLLRSKLSIPLAAGESDFTVAQAAPAIAERLLDVIQPNVTRSGGISGVREIIAFAAANNVAYATHVGFSGIVCETVSLHLAAAAPNLHSVELPNNPNLFLGLADRKPAREFLQDGSVPVPTGPGIGIDINWDAVEPLRVR